MSANGPNNNSPASVNGACAPMNPNEQTNNGITHTKIFKHIRTDMGAYRLGSDGKKEPMESPLNHASDNNKYGNLQQFPNRKNNRHESKQDKVKTNYVGINLNYGEPGSESNPGANKHGFFISSNKLQAALEKNQFSPSTITKRF